MLRHAIPALLLCLASSGCYHSHSPCDEPGADPDCALPPPPAMTTTSYACPAGEGPTYTEQYLGSTASDMRSSISEGDGRDVTVTSCEPSPCAPDQAHVIFSSGDDYCTSLPPECPAGTTPRFTFSSEWRCDAPCDYIVHYGYLYLGQNVCAPAPPTCPGGSVPTFDVYDENWVCRHECDGGEYDPVYLGTTLVCVPC